MEQKNKNFQAVVVGLILITAVFLITFARYYFHSKNADQADNAGQLDSSRAIPEKGSLSKESLLERIQKEEKIIILDFRPAADFKKEHLIDSRNVLLSELGKNPALFSDKDASYVIMDEADSVQSGILAEKISSDFSLKDVFYLKGGFSEWKNSSYPTIADGDPYSVVDQSKTKKITSVELKKELETKNNLFLLDVRSPENFQNGHIARAANIPLDDLEKRRREIPPGKEIVVYDKDGLWAFKAASRLFDLGFFRVRYLSDGLNGWLKNKFETEK